MGSAQSPLRTSSPCNVRGYMVQHRRSPSPPPRQGGYAGVPWGMYAPGSCGAPCGAPGAIPATRTNSGGWTDHSSGATPRPTAPSGTRSSSSFRMDPRSTAGSLSVTAAQPADDDGRGRPPPIVSGVSSSHSTTLLPGTAIRGVSRTRDGASGRGGHTLEPPSPGERSTSDWRGIYASPAARASSPMPQVSGMLVRSPQRAVSPSWSRTGASQAMPAAVAPRAPPPGFVDRSFWQSPRAVSPVAVARPRLEPPQNSYSRGRSSSRAISPQPAPVFAAAQTFTPAGTRAFSPGAAPGPPPRAGISWSAVPPSPNGPTNRSISPTPAGSSHRSSSLLAAGGIRTLPTFVTNSPLPRWSV